ncbi:MAG: hypothetical protein RLZZ184_2737 [Cyanobacteriota bacterium]|jgi:hypothetical protein
MGQFEFDVFLCHNSQDKTAVIEIAQQLKLTQIKPWLDDWELQPGLPWQPELEKQIQNIKSAAVFIGQSGIGPWQEEEINSFLREFHRRKCPVIPILLPNAPQKPKLPLFLEGRTWVDFRTGSSVNTDHWKKLVWGITGIKPDSQSVVQTQQLQISSLPQKIWLLSDFSSEKGIDYTHLAKLLSEGKWEDANTLTYQLMLDAVGKNKGDKLTKEDLRNFPCTDIKTIDKLWFNHSNSKFGFSIQKEIYLSIGGKLDSIFDQILWKNFGDIVGWRDVNGDYFFDASDDQHIFDHNSAPKGHLPVLIEYDNPGIVINIFPLIEADIQSQSTKTLEFVNSYLGSQPNILANQALEIINSLPNIQLPTQTDDIASERGIDYFRLSDLLKAHKWKEADIETYRLMIQAVDREEGDLNKKERLNFPSTDLCTIDRLWRTYSNGIFGFSVQKKILLSIGGMADGNYEKKTWKEFYIEVGWIVNNNWISYSDLSFDASMPVGHLPRRVFSGKSYGRNTGLYLLSHRDL